MHFKQILVVKETREHEKRVALTPSVVEQLTQKGYKILVERDAGIGSGFSNENYLQAGAGLFSLKDEQGFPDNSFIVRVLRPAKQREKRENQLFGQNSAMLGFLFPFVADDHIPGWQQLGLTTLSFDLFHSLSIDDPKNAQAAMSRFAGKLALHDALKHYQGIDKANLTVIGLGAAGFSAALEGLKLGLSVQVFTRNELYRSQLEAQGVRYFVLPEESQQIAFIRSHLTQATLVITAARTPGKQAPILIDEDSLKIMPSNAIVIDLAISNGGNVVGSRHDQLIRQDNGVSLLNVSGYPKREPKTASEAYANCVHHLLTEIMSPDGTVDFDNKWVQEIWVTHNKQTNNKIYNEYIP